LDCDTAIREDIITGQEQILGVMGLTDWEDMKHYLSLPGCPVYSSPGETKKRGPRLAPRWVARRSALVEWARTVRPGQANPEYQSASVPCIPVHEDDTALRDDLIVGRDQILYVMKLSHWDYMAPYLALPRCPITQVIPEGAKRGRWMTRRSLLDRWLTDIMMQNG